MLTAGQFQDYDFNRMVVRFTMKNDEASVACAISVSYTHLTLPTSDLV